MTTNKTFLIFLLAGLSYTAYNAAAVSENFAISTTIDHEITLGNFRTASADADLDVTGDIDFGTITVDFSDGGWGDVFYSHNSVYSVGGAVVSATSTTSGRFTANIPNPEECSNGLFSCAGLSITGDGILSGILSGDNSYDNYCEILISYEGENRFYISPNLCYFATSARISPGVHTKTITISYGS
ncbi:MAG: hypothetical protein IJ689_05450 [Alphaproteobacteria bacterium]|nr:hypothetical protein [Alphaproteobacteria bacterium]